MNKQKIIIIVGPTASGKTALSIRLAREYAGEVISADSRQVYKGLDIGTGKVTKQEMDGIPHHLIDVADPVDTFSADMFVRMARTAISTCKDHGHVPIIAGGTGFYIDALLGNVHLGGAPADKELRFRLSTWPTSDLCAHLQSLDERRYNSIVEKNETNNRVRLIRAIEIATHSPAHTTLHNKTDCPYDALWIGITHPREVLRERINIRLHERIENGMFDEMRRLHARGLTLKRMHELGLEYRYGAEYIQGNLSLEETERILQQKIWQYARRQTTYWKRNTHIRWFDVRDIQAISDTVRSFLVR